MAHRPIGAASSIAVTGTAATTGEISVQSNVFRIVAVNQDAYVAIGTEPIATKTDYLIPANTAATLAVTKASQRVVGVTTGTTTIITCPEGTQMPFVEGDRVTLTGANFAHYDTLIKHTLRSFLLIPHQLLMEISRRVSRLILTPLQLPHHSLLLMQL